MTIFHDIIFYLHARFLATLLLCLALTPASAETSDPKSAKTIAKLILMLYCHAALDTLQADVEKNSPSANVSASKQKAMREVFQFNKTELGA